MKMVLALLLFCGLLSAAACEQRETAYAGNSEEDVSEINELNLNDTAFSLKNEMTAYITSMDARGFSTDRNAEITARYTTGDDAKWTKISGFETELFKSAPEISFDDFIADRFPDLKNAEITFKIAYGVCAECEVDCGLISGAYPVTE